MKVYALFTISGASGLIYQILWARWLALVFGNTAASVSIVLGSFMLGLSLGSWLAGRRVHRIANPMRFYALLELGIGLFAVAFPLLSGAVDHLFTLLVNTDTPPVLSLFVRALLSFLLLVFPTTLMGATLPVLTHYFRKDTRRTRSWKVGVLYAANTLGAALGTLAAGFVLIELAGIRTTTLLAAALNGVVAFLGYRMSRPAAADRRRLPLSGSGAAPSPAPPLDGPGRLTLAVLFATGALALASEVLWTRALEILIGQSTYAFSMIVVCYLLGIALGSWLMSLVVNRAGSLAAWLAGLQAGMGIWTILSILLFDLLSKSIAAYASVPVSIPRLLWIYLEAISILIPLALLSGAVFPVATRILDPEAREADGASVARAYAWNTLGALLGSLAAGFLLAPFLDYFQSVYSVAVLYALSAALTCAAFFVLRRPGEPSGRALPPILGLAALLCLGYALPKALEGERFKKRFNARNGVREVVFHRPGLQGVTSVLKRRDRKYADRLLVNGTGMTAKVTDTKVMAHLPLIAHPRPKKVLVICFGMGTTYRSVLSHGVEATVVELVKEVYEAFDWFYGDAPEVRACPRGRMVVNDGRNFLKLSRERYDVITIDPPPPIDAAGVNNLYSRDFLELCRAHLAKGGIMAHWIPYPSINAGVDDDRTFGMLLDTFASVFPHAYYLESWNKIGFHLLGSADRPIRIRPDRLARGLGTAAVAADLREWDPVPGDYLTRLAPYRASSPRPLCVTDDRPRLEFHLLRSWRFGVDKTLHTVYW